MLRLQVQRGRNGSTASPFPVAQKLMFLELAGAKEPSTSWTKVTKSGSFPLVNLRRKPTRLLARFCKAKMQGNCCGPLAPSSDRTSPSNTAACSFKRDVHGLRSTEKLSLLMGQRKDCFAERRLGGAREEARRSSNRNLRRFRVGRAGPVHRKTDVRKKPRLCR